MKMNGQQIRKSIRKNWQLYLFLLLPIVYIIVFKYVPMGGVIIAFKDFKLRQGIWGSDWVGLEHFIRFFGTYQCKKVIKNTLMQQLFAVVEVFVLTTIILKSLLHRQFQHSQFTISLIQAIIHQR